MQRAVGDGEDTGIEAGNGAIDTDRHVAGTGLHPVAHFINGVSNDAMQMSHQIPVLNEINEIFLPTYTR